MLDPKKLFPFAVETLTPLAFRASWTVPADLPYLEGHFPGNPVLPAVAIIDGTQELLRVGLRRETLSLFAVVSAKFLALIAPGQTIEITVSPLSAADKEADLPDTNREWLARWQIADPSSGPASPPSLRALAELRVRL